MFEFAKPRRVGLLQPTDERSTLHSLNLPIDPGARPFLESLECEVQIDHDYVARVTLMSKGRGEIVKSEFHNLDFGLALPTTETGMDAPDDISEPGNDEGEPKTRTQSAGTDEPPASSVIALRSNVSSDKNWTLVPGDVVKKWKPNFLDKNSREASKTQHAEAIYYAKCSRCGRTEYEIRTQGPVDECHRFQCSEVRPSIPNSVTPKKGDDGSIDTA